MVILLWGGAYMWDLTFYLANTPPLLGPRLDVDIGTLNYRLLQKLVRHWSAFASLVLQKVNGQTEVGDSVDGGVFQALHGFVFQHAIALTPLADTLVIVGELLSWSVDAGFVRALLLPWRHWTWQCRSFNEKSFAMVGGAYLRDKSTCARTSTGNVGGAYMRRGRICGTLR